MIQSDKTKWVNAMEKEMESLHTEVWELGSKWVFKTKKGANGTIERHKGRLVAEGYSQRYGQAPVSQRTVAWFELLHGLKLHQMDVKWMSLLPS